MPHWANDDTERVLCIEEQQPRTSDFSTFARERRTQVN